MGAGAVWKTRREELGKTLEEVSLDLRVSQKYLRGIEEGNFSRWPAKVFSAGFIRAYANFLSMDPEPVLSEYYEFLGMQAVQEPPFQANPEWLERERRKGSRRAAYAIAAVAVLVVGVFLGWYGRRAAQRPLPPLEGREAFRLPSAAAPVQDNASPVDQEQEGSMAPVSRPASSPEIGKPAPEGEPASAPYQLFLEASDLTWIMYGRDGAEPVDVMLYPGDRLSIQAQEKIYLKIGNAGGVVGTLNGNLLPPFGQRGQVKEITLGE